MARSPEKTSPKAALAVAALTTFMAPFMISAVNIALPAIQAEFAVDAVVLGWLANAYLLATGVALVPAGKIADIYGRRKIFITGILVFTVATTATAVMPSISWIILLRILQGMGAAMTMTTGIAIISAVFPPSERGKAIGITVSSVYIGLSVGPFAGGLLTGAFGWRAIFLINAPIGAAALLLAALKIREEWADAAGERFDVAGSLFYGVALVCLMYGLSILPARLGLGLLGGGALAMGLFIRHELRTAFPVFEVRLFRQNRTFTYSSLAALINYAATFAVAFLMSLYLQYIKGMSPEAAGTVLICQPGVMALFSPAAGRLSDRIEPAAIASAGMALTAAGLAALAFLSADTDIPYIIVSLVVLGLGFALFSSPNMNAIMGSVEKRHYGVASGTVATMRLVGQMLSMTLATLAFSFFIGSAQIAPPVYPRFLEAVTLCFAAFSVMCAGGIYFSLARGTLHSRSR
ncbi:MULTISPECIES: MFS transporter [Desulfococcus]|jgi:EmrB/QacA subfamily drug resistance transporter|uniref:Major facilitator superfamily MFS_1 n=1 Tax=Desulfococcus multivorans DSM 2059 TaxID=1121405 RepID=S7U0V3_DESML|nr:MFS transporter [Desulfococcus multivorans]AOY60396.1 major facilitator superfamily MFS1 protein [Desulfococcus multivorans]AQV02495.1 MFS transporter [Desulfococcus multivorans]EPR43066.1 major facilitator superfamily MFS_1 [Desulfococcus multivorans DSM 2059]MDX9817814.1 MFS transporter [Desulfococcus multivorans]SJZ60568.1 drug resistance transporter, EmrB/QacA subfamily [Desulfococcus multivorans DSM 2059]